MSLLSVEEVSQQLCTSKKEVFNLSRRRKDPLPLLILRGKKRGAYILESDFADWVRRNSCLYTERDRYDDRVE